MSLVILVLVSFAHAAAAASTVQRPLTDFQDANVGVRFSHSSEISTLYNPHGGADRVHMSFRGDPIGGLLIRAAPTDGSVEEFVAAGKEYLETRHGASSVDYALHENPNQYAFHHFTLETTIRDAIYVIDPYVYLREACDADSEGSAIVAALSGAFSFEFVYRKEDEAELSPEIRTVVNSFRIVSSP